MFIFVGSINFKIRNMDSFGDIIYLLLIVGAVISGLVKKSKKMTKPQANPRPVAEQPEEEVDWKDIFKQMIPEEKKPQPVYQAPQANPGYQSYETTKNPADLRIKKNFVSTNIDYEDETSDNETSDIINEISFATPADAKAAFVYSEILTRKY